MCFEHSSDNPDEAEFDMIVGCLEELVMDDSFQSLMTGYYKKHCGELLM